MMDMRATLSARLPGQPPGMDWIALQRGKKAADWYLDCGSTDK